MINITEASSSFFNVFSDDIKNGALLGAPFSQTSI
jgi:hypothetical protein